MKVKIKLRNMGCKRHHLWHLIVQGHKKNLKGRYIEHIGHWLPRHGTTYARGVVLNKHKVRYWLSVGAQPTPRVAQLLSLYGMFPAPATPWGAATRYETPKKDPPVHHYPLQWRGLSDPKREFRSRLQGEINRVERERRIQAEALAGLGEGANQLDVEVMKTDDMESDEVDIFKRVEKFKELQKRMEQHKTLRGNDLRYNVYLKKMQKLVRKDLGLDVEAYKNYVNNIKIFAKYNRDYEILAQDDVDIPRGVFPGLGDGTDDYAGAEVDYAGMDRAELAARVLDKTKRLTVTIKKLTTDFRMQVYQKDHDIVEEFERDPFQFLDHDAHLVIDLKHLYDKRKEELRKRANMGVNNIAKITDQDLKDKGVTKREFDLIKKFLALDPEIFAVKEHLDASPYTYAVDLSKYERAELKKELKDVLYRPKKMRQLYERYWSLASAEDLEGKELAEYRMKNRWTPRRPPKIEEQTTLLDRVVRVLDTTVKERREADARRDPVIDQVRALLEKEEHITRNPMTLFAKDGFEKHAAEIQNQIVSKGFCTKAQLEFLLLFNEQCDFEKRLLIDRETLSDTKIFKSKQDGPFSKLLREMYRQIMKRDSPALATVSEQSAYNAVSLLSTGRLRTEEDQRNALAEAELSSRANSRPHEEALPLPEAGEEDERTIELALVRRQVRAEQCTAAAAEELTDKEMPIERTLLSPEVKEKFAKMHTCKGFLEKTEILQWAVDSMRSEILDHFEASAALDGIADSEKLAILQQIDDTQQQCKDELFKLHQSQAQGQLVDHTESYAKLLGQIDSLKSKIQIADIESGLLELLNEHNQKVDRFTRRFSHNDLLLAELSKLPQFQSEEEQALPAGPAGSLDLDRIGQLARAQRDLEEIEYLQANLDLLSDGDRERLAELLETQERRQARAAVQAKSEAAAKAEKVLKKLEYRLALAGRHNLDYARLYQDRGGGYDMETLTRVLKDMKEDREERGLSLENLWASSRTKNGLVAGDLDQKLTAYMQERMKKRQAEAEAQEKKGEAAAENEEGAEAEEEAVVREEEGEEEAQARKCFEIKDIIMRQINFSSTDEIVEELVQYLQGDGSQVFTNMLSEEELDVIEHTYFYQWALHLKPSDFEGETPEEAADAFLDAYLSWMKETKFVKRKGRAYQYDAKQKRDLEFRKINPYYKQITDHLRESRPPFSFAENAFLPNDRAAYDEKARRESLIGRYPVGFRHYENYRNYLVKHPDATIGDYTEDVNARVTFDEFLAIKKAHWLYQCKYDPETIYTYGLHTLDPRNPNHHGRLPETVVASEEFKDQTRQEYLALVQENLVARQWFKKVDALEYFGDYEDWGRGVKWVPKHNAYTPAPTIMPIPKFEDYDKADELGKAFSYRTADSHTPSPLVQPRTMKPLPFEPPLPTWENPFFEHHNQRRMYKIDKWRRDRKLSKSKRQAWKAVQMPTKWGFSTAVPANITPEEEEKLVREHEQAYKEKQVQINVRQCVMQPWGNLASLFGAGWPFFGPK